MPDMGILIGGGVVFLLLVILLIARSRKKADEPQAPVHVPPNPFDKPPTSGPVSTAPTSGHAPVAGPTSSPLPTSGPVSSPLQAGPVSGPISTPGGAPPPVSGPISSPSKGSDVDALLASDEGTAIMPGAPLRPIENDDDDDDLRTQAQDRPPVDLDAHEAETAQPPDVSPVPPPAAPAPAPEPVVEAKKPEPAKPAPPKPPPPAARPASDPAIKPPAAPIASKATSPATPAAMADAMKKDAARPKLASKPDVPQDAELDFSALRDKKQSDAKLGAAAPAPAAAPAAEAKAPAPSAATSPAARFVPASNPETAELEKSDPRHAAARRLARLSVSEIKLYHEAEVKEGREKKDLWKRLLADITLAIQTYDKRVDQEVRERFDYIHDEIVRQLAEGNAELLGADAPKAKTGGAKPAEAKAKAEAPKPVEAPKPAAEAPKAAEPAAAPAPASESSKVTAPAVTRPAGPPTNPETAELEKSDPRHAAARRLARLSVSEIKLYHEGEVKEGREKKDLYSRLGADISLAKQTYEKRVDQEVRDRFDYLYDEIVRQLAEGNAELLGKDAPPPPSKAAPKPADAPKAEPAKVEAPKAEAPKSEPKVEAPKPAAAAPAEPAKPTMPGVKYAPPTNPETAELEKGDPRHAAARRLARLSVSEIKLYHEADVKEGREKKDLYSRLGADISLAKQTYEKRVDQEVRDRFDYLYDEIVRQLAEGNAELLGKDAPPPPVSKAAAPAPPPAAAPPPAPAAEPAKVEAPKSEPKIEAPKPPEPAKAEAKPEPAKEEPKPAAPAPSAATQPSAVSKYVAPSNPATADLEKADPRHAAARRLARLSVSEIKLYHEAEVKEGREKKDLYTRLGADIALAKQTFEKRVDQEVRDRFDYLYDEIVRQLAEGNADLLGSGAPPKPPNN